MIISLIVLVLTLVSLWMIFRKMGRQGWEGIVPFYREYLLCYVLYGNGWKFLFLLIPFYNIYFAFKLYIDLAHGFHMGTGFGIGLLLLPFIFGMILAFGKAQFGDGTCENQANDFVAAAVSKTKEFATNIETKAKEPKKDDMALDKLLKLNELKEKGIITDEEYEAKKAELMQRI